MKWSFGWQSHPMYLVTPSYDKKKTKTNKINPKTSILTHKGKSNSQEDICKVSHPYGL